MWFTLISTSFYLTLAVAFPCPLLLSPGAQYLPGECFKVWFSCVLILSLQLRGSDCTGQEAEAGELDTVPARAASRFPWLRLPPTYAATISSPTGRTRGKPGTGQHRLKLKNIYRRLLETLSPKEF